MRNEAGGQMSGQGQFQPLPEFAGADITLQGPCGYCVARGCLHVEDERDLVCFLHQPECVAAHSRCACDSLLH